LALRSSKNGQNMGKRPSKCDTMAHSVTWTERTPRKKSLPACTFFGTVVYEPRSEGHNRHVPSGKEPVRDWLLKLAAVDRKIIGGDMMAVEMGWPCGEPLCKSLSGYTGL